MCGCASNKIQVERVEDGYHLEEIASDLPMLYGGGYRYVKTEDGFEVESIPNKNFKGPIIIPECMVEYLEKAEKLREEYNGLLIKQLFNLEEEKMNKQKYDKT